MLKNLYLLIVTLTSVSAATFSLTRANTTEVPYPDGYRRWVHVKSQLIGPGNPMHASVGGLHHVYANPTAMEGIARGQYADGSMFVFDVLNVETKNDVTSETTRRLIDVMVKDSARYAAVGGWGFEEFKGDAKTGTLEEPRRAQCAQCHATKKASGNVFSVFRS